MASASQTFRPGTGQTAAPPSAAQTSRPFCQASKHGTQQTAVVTTSTDWGATASQFGPQTLTASGGFIRNIQLEFSGANADNTGIPADEYPWRYSGKIRLSEPNNTPILELSGWNLLMSNVYGGYAGVVDPRNDPDYNDQNNPFYTLTIPVDLDPTGLGALSDLSASSGYQLTVFTNPNTDARAYSTAPTDPPEMTVTAYTNYWTLPNQTDMNGRPQQTTPPYPGTVQLWNEIPNISLPAGGGSSRQQLNRMGNQIRTIIMVTRANGPRSDVPFPNPLLLRWDDVILRNQDPATLRKYISQFTNNKFQGRDTGVHVFPFSFGITRLMGGNGVSALLPTVTDTRFELSGTFGAATSPTIDWLVNDISSAPLSGLERTTVGGGLGYYPPAGTPQPGTM
jgi:hypothetical protein